MIFLKCQIFFWIVLREMFPGQRWRKNKLYKAPMMETPSMQLYVGDFINFSHSSLGIACGKVQRFYMKIRIDQHTYTFFSTLHCCKNRRTTTMCSSRCRCYQTLSSFVELAHKQGPPCTVIQIVLSNTKYVRCFLLM